MSDSAPIPPQQNGDEPQGVEDLLSRCVDELNEVGFIDPQQVLAAHPVIGPAVLEDLKAYIQLRSDGNESRPLGTLGDYTLRRQIGRGGMGVVYEAWQNSMDRQVALKVMPKAIAVDTRAVARFIQEAQLAGKLNHPNIVHVHGMGVEQQIPYYAMDFVEGETLAQIVAKLKEAEPEAETPFGPKDEVDYFVKLARAFADVADGLQHAHSHKIIHRDIKPSNLILDREGRLRILDFGLARLEGQESLTASGDLVGTPQYMSPEQARRKKIPIDHRTDVYSLGATLYEMLTLQPPFRGKDHNDTLSQIIDRDAVEPRKINPRVPRDLETIVLKCLRKEAADRYGTAEALGQDLRRFVRGEVIEARAETRWERAVRRTWRLRRTLAVGLLVLAASVVMVGQVLSWRREKQLRLEERYDSLVRQAVLRLELVSAAQKGEAGGWGGWLIPVSDNTVNLGGPATDPAALALGDLENAAALLPDRADAQYHRARALLYLGRGQESRNTLQTLARRTKPFVPALTLQSRLLELRADRENAARALEAAQLAAGEPWEKAWVDVDQAWKNKDYNLAVEAYDKLLAASATGEPFPGLVLVARMGRGAAWKALKSYGYALEDFSIAGYLAHGALEPVILEGEALLLLGRDDEAKNLFKKLFDGTLRRDESALTIANVYFELSREPESLEWLDRVQNDSIRESQKAWAHFNSGRVKEAKVAGRKAIELDSANVDAYVALAFAYFELGPSELAARVLEEGLKHRETSWTILHYLGWSLMVAGRSAEAIPRFEEASRLALNPAGEYSRIAQAYMLLGDDAMGDDWARRAQDVDPKNLSIYRDRGYSLFLRGRLDEAFETASRDDSHGYCAKVMGVVRFIQQNWDEAIEIFHRGQKLKPINATAFVGAALIHARRGEPTQAMEEIAHLFEISPADVEAHELLAKLLRGNTAPIARETLELLARALEECRVQDAQNPTILNSLALVLAALPDEDSLRRAIQATLDGFDAAEASGNLVAPLGLTLRSICSAARSRPRLSGFLPLPSYVGIDALFEGSEGSLQAACEALSTAQSPAQDGTATSQRRLYLRAKLLEAKGQHVEAERAVRELIAQETGRPEPVLLLASALRGQGKSLEAEKTLRTSLESAKEQHRELWQAWLEVSFRDLHRSAPQVLEGFPKVPASESPPPDENFLAALDYAEKHANRTNYAEDSHWLLEELASGRSLRIRCGGDAVTLKNGQVWGRDRFFLGGQKPQLQTSTVDIRRTELDDLYRRSRVFFGSHPAAGGYAIPVPPGSWRVHLHFAETEFNWPGQRRMEVIVQGTVVLKDFEVLEKVPFNTALETVFEATVDKGPLEIQFSSGLQLLSAMISAIEVEQVD